MKKENLLRKKSKEQLLCFSKRKAIPLTMATVSTVYMDEPDEFAKRFDNFMYGLMIAQMETTQQFVKGKKDLILSPLC